MIIELTFTKELMLIKQMNQKSVIFFTVGSFLDIESRLQIYVSNGCHNLSMILINIDYVAILNINCIDYRSVVNKIDKNETANLLRNVNL